MWVKLWRFVEIIFHFSQHKETSPVHHVNCVEDLGQRFD